MNMDNSLNARDPRRASQDSGRQRERVSMHEDRLRQLNTVLPRVQAYVEGCHALADNADVLLAYTVAEIAEETREHRHLHSLGAFAPALVGFAAAGLEVAHRWAARNGTTIATFGAGAMMATAITLSVTQTDTSPPRPPPLAEPAPPLPPIGGTPPRVGPPKGNQPRAATPPPPTTRPRPTSPPSSPAVPPVPLPSAPPIPDPPADPPTDTETDGGEPDGIPCRLNVLGHGLMCGHRR